MTARIRKSLPPQTMFWTGLFIFIILMVWLLHAVLPPFITGLALAYLFNPLATRLSKRMPRTLATFIVLIGSALIIFGLVMTFSPLVGKQLSDFIDNFPDYYDKVSQYITVTFDKWMGRLRPEDVKQVRAAAGEQVGNVLTGAKTVLGHIWVGGMALIDIATFCVITPVVAFYFLRDWPKIVKRIDNLLPRKHARTVRTMMREFNMRLGGFVRGQLLVCLSLGVMYATGLTIVGLNFGLAIGMIAGILSFVPYIGSIFGFVASISVALVQFDDTRMVFVVIGIFFIGQFIEGNFLAPKLVGDRVGLHAVWIIFALLAGGQLFGFTGLLLAVPTAALFGVVIRHAIIWYQHSPAYLGVPKK
jgi:predicted PurR-regulated permease PerM